MLYDDEEIVAVIGLDAPTGGLPPMTQCTGCGRYIDGLCSVCPRTRERTSEHDHLDYERHRNRRRREDRLMAVRHGERI